MSSEPLKDPIREATKGALDWTLEKINELVIKLKNRQIAFVEDIETINIAKNQRKTPEWIFFKDNVEDGDLRILFQMGLTLRRLENEGQDKSLHSLREKLFRKYGEKGLHIAQLVQNGVFNKFLGNILERTATPEELKSEIENLLRYVDIRVVFIQSGDDLKIKTNSIVAKINANSPDTFIICSAGSAMKNCKIITENVMRQIPDYTLELYKSDIKRIYILNRKEGIDLNLPSWAR